MTILIGSAGVRWRLEENRKESRMHEYIAFDSHKHYTWVEREEVAAGKRSTVSSIRRE